MGATIFHSLIAEASASLQDVVVAAVTSGSLSLLIGTAVWNIVKQSHCFPFLVTSWLSLVVAESHTCMLNSLGRGKWKLFPVIVVIVEELRVVFSCLWFLIQQMEFTVLFAEFVSALLK